MKNRNSLIRFWLSPKLVRQYQRVNSNILPKGLFGKLKVYIKHWLIHPVKRRIAKVYLILLKALGLKVIGITGSAGKTSTKDMLSSILKLEEKTVSSKENIDPVFNIPSTILKCKFSTKYLILEMGVEYKNEMDFFLWLASVDVGVITNISNTHTEFFGNKNGVLEEKIKLAKSLSKKGVMIINRQDKSWEKISKASSAKKMYFGKGGEVYSKDEEITDTFDSVYTLVSGKEEIRIQLPIVGKQFVLNSLAASSVAINLGIDLEKVSRGLSSFSRPPHRMKVIKHKSGAVILDDSYNNNPSAAISAIDTLVSLAGENKKIVVFGDMLELGSLETSEHRRVGKYLVKRKINSVIGVGKASKELVNEVGGSLERKNVFHAGSSKKVLPLLYPMLKKNTFVLVKGSRSIGLDKLILKLLK